MSASRFVYVTYIRSPIEKVWDALRQPEFTRLYWSGFQQDCAWIKGASWELRAPDGALADKGQVLDIAPPRRLVLSWQNMLNDELRAEGVSRARPLIWNRSAMPPS